MKVSPFLRSGRPVLATDLPMHTQVLDGSTAMLAARDPRSFGDAMVRLSRDAALRNRALRNRLGVAGRAFVEANHTFAAHERRVNRLYDSTGSVRGRVARRGGSTDGDLWTR